MSIKVAVVDDQALVRSGFATMLGLQDDIEVVAEAGDGAAAVEIARAHRPDVILMDIRMPEMDGLAATEAIVDSADWPVKVLILTTFDPDEYVYKALQAGASGFVLKDISPEDLVAAVRTVADGGALLAPSVTRRLISRFAAPPSLDPLVVARSTGSPAGSGRSSSPLQLGSSNIEIAENLFVGAATVKSHVSSILTKLGLNNRAQVVAFAYESGLVKPGDSDLGL